MSLVWQDQFSIGNIKIDNDHKKQIEIINKIELEFENNPTGLINSLEELFQFSRTHFAREEAIAHVIGYKQAPHLNRSHQNLLAQLEHLKGEIDTMGAEWPAGAAKFFVHFLRRWLIDHIVMEDRLMKPLFEKHQSNFDSSQMFSLHDLSLKLCVPEG